MDRLQQAPTPRFPVLGRGAPAEEGPTRPRAKAREGGCLLGDTTEDVCKLLCTGKRMRHTSRAGTRWCARYYRPSHPRPCSSHPDQGTLNWHLPTLPIWGRGSLVPFRIWSGVPTPAHDLPQRRRRVLFLSGPLCAGASLEATGEDFARGLGTGVPSKVVRIGDL